MKMEWRIVSWRIFVSLWRQCLKDRPWRSGCSVIRLRKRRRGWDQMLPKPHVSLLDDLRDIVGDWERARHRWMGAEG